MSNTSLINLEHLAPITFQFSTSNKIYEMKGNSSKENQYNVYETHCFFKTTWG